MKKCVAPGNCIWCGTRKVTTGEMGRMLGEGFRVAPYPAWKREDRKKRWKKLPTYIIRYICSFQKPDGVKRRQRLRYNWDILGDYESNE